MPTVESTKASPVLAVHPAAAVFPMLTDDELADLAADIRANGLLHPIVLDADGVLIDGRNRLAACKLAGVEPTFTELNGHDPVAFILSSNIHRRQMTKGQAAMAVVRCKETLQGSTRDLGSTIKVSHQRIHQAHAVLEYAADLSDLVLSGAKSLDEAYAEARSRKSAASSTEALMARLREEAPDLADQVTEERLSVREAMAVLEQRIRDQREARRVATQLAGESLSFLDPRGMTAEELADSIVGKLDPSLLPNRPDFSPRRVKRCLAVLTAILTRLNERSNRAES